MKKGKAQGPDDISEEMWIALGTKGVQFLANLFNRLLGGEKMLNDWRRSVLVPLYKGKGGRQRVWKLPGDQVDESYYETVEESIRFKVKKMRRQF